MTKPISAVIGNFDGVHRGHQRLFEALSNAKKRRGGTALAITFYPHPVSIISKKLIPQITTNRQKIALIDAQGADYLCLMHFTSELSKIRAWEFIEEILFKRLDVTHLVLGPDTAIGHSREGTPAFIKKYFESNGRSCEEVGAEQSESLKIGSAHIRAALSEGRVEEAARLLGREFRFQGHVVKGAGRGADLGVRTLNLRQQEQILPKSGVYVTRAFVGKKRYASVSNVGVRPTFGGDSLTLETHLLGYSGRSIYGKLVEVEFLQRIRDEIKFGSKDQLVHQIQNDIESTRKYFRG